MHNYRWLGRVLVRVLRIGVRGMTSAYLERPLRSEAEARAMSDKRVKGYAVIANEKIDMRTVSDTRRAAIVNWLVVEGGRMVFSTTTDEEIEQMWVELRGTSRVVAVEIGLAP